MAWITCNFLNEIFKINEYNTTTRIGILSLLIAFGSFVVALLAFLDRDKDHKRKK